MKAVNIMYGSFAVSLMHRLNLRLTLLYILTGQELSYGTW